MKIAFSVERNGKSVYAALSIVSQPQVLKEGIELAQVARIKVHEDAGGTAEGICAEMTVSLNSARRQLDFGSANIHRSVTLSVCCVDRARCRDLFGNGFSGWIDI